jgi:hypothetical protein
MSINPSRMDRNAAFAESKEALVIDDFESDEIFNALNQKSNVYVKAPSKIMITHREDMRTNNPTIVLYMKFDKANEGGPYGTGGWCGYYTLLKDEKEGTYFDGTNYTYVSFWVKALQEGINFNVGLSDRHWDKIGDSLKSEQIVTYIKGNTVPLEWTYVRVPLEEFFLDYTQLAAITINFESDCFPEGKGAGELYIDDLMLEK